MIVGNARGEKLKVELSKYHVACSVLHWSDAAATVAAETNHHRDRDHAEPTSTGARARLQLFIVCLK